MRPACGPRHMVVASVVGGCRCRRGGRRRLLTSPARRTSGGLGQAMSSDDAIVATPDALQTFLRVLFPTDVGYMDLRGLPSRAQIFVPIGDEEAVDAFRRAHANENCYVG